MWWHALVTPALTALRWGNPGACCSSRLVNQNVSPIWTKKNPIKLNYYINMASSNSFFSLKFLPLKIQLLTPRTLILTENQLTDESHQALWRGLCAYSWHTGLLQYPLQAYLRLCLRWCHCSNNYITLLHKRFIRPVVLDNTGTENILTRCSTSLQGFLNNGCFEL